MKHMSFNEYYRLEMNRYPEYVMQKEMAAILGICKSKAYLLLKQGLIPFEYTGASTGRTQKIKTADILLYQYEHMCFSNAKKEFGEELHRFYQNKLKDSPQLLLVSDVMRFTGYVRTTVNNWILHGKLQALCYKDKRITSPRRGKGTLLTKESFIDFLASPYYRNIIRKSNLHKEQEKEYKQLFIALMSKRGVAHG